MFSNTFQILINTTKELLGKIQNENSVPTKPLVGKPVKKACMQLLMNSLINYTYLTTENTSSQYFRNQCCQLDSVFSFQKEQKNQFENF